MAEAIFHHLAGSRFSVYSAGSQPTGAVHPVAIKTLEKNGIAASHYKSQSWDDFQEIPIELVITVCDNAASTPCPVFLGSQMKAHWGVSDPALAQGTEEEVQSVFDDVFHSLERRITLFLELPIEQLSRKELEIELKRAIADF